MTPSTIAAMRLLTPASPLFKPVNSQAITEFLLTRCDGELIIDTHAAETYVLKREAGALSLGLPDGDYSGDPMVVELFNRVMANHRQRA
jgi:hypothetical protein